MKQCSPQQVQQIRSQQEANQMSMDTPRTHGCQMPHSNSAYAEDHGLSAPREKTAAHTYLENVFTPGNATGKGLEAVGDWIENGFDGEKDGQWEQLGRAIPGALLMGGTVIFGNTIDTVSALFGQDPFGD